MKKLNYFFLLLSFSLLLTAISCNSDDESEPDYIQESVGQYNYNVVLTLIADRNVTVTDNGTLEITRSGQLVTLIFDKGTSAEFQIKSSSIEVASNGYGFDITTTSDVDGDGDRFDIIGVSSFAISGVNYHGAYDTGRKQIELSFRSDYQNSAYDDYNIEAKFIATKK